MNFTTIIICILVLGVILILFLDFGISTTNQLNKSFETNTFNSLNSTLSEFHSKTLANIEEIKNRTTTTNATATQQIDVVYMILTITPNLFNFINLIPLVIQSILQFAWFSIPNWVGYLVFAVILLVLIAKIISFIRGGWTSL